MVAIKNEEFFSVINDQRREGIKGRNDMVRYKEIKQGRQLVNNGILETVARSRSEVADLLANIKCGKSKSINLRRRINNDVDLEMKSQGKMPRLDEVDAENFLPNIEKWELKARDLLKHRISKCILASSSKSLLIAQYQTRMEEYDEAFDLIKNEESCPMLEEIIETFEKYQEKKEEILNKEYIISNDCSKSQATNNVINKRNIEMKIMLRDMTVFNIVNTGKKEEKDSLIDGKHAFLNKEITTLNDEFLEFKNLVFNSFLYMQETTLGKNVPTSSDMVQKEFVALGAFNPLKLMGWYTQVIIKIETLGLREKKCLMNNTFNTENAEKNSYNKADNSTTIDVSRSKGDHSFDQVHSNNILTGLDELDDNHGMNEKTDFEERDITIHINTQNNKNEKQNFRQALRRTSNFRNTQEDQHKKISQTMADFALRYGEQDDYLNANKMMDLNNVRRKNYETIVNKINRTGMRRSSSAFKVNNVLDDTTNGGTLTDRNLASTDNYGNKNSGVLPAINNFQQSLGRKDHNASATNTLRNKTEVIGIKGNLTGR